MAVLMAVLMAGCAERATAQPRVTRFEHFSTEEGLSQSSILCMLQDRQGYLWMGTQNGVNQYDGNAITVYRAAGGDLAATDNFVTALHETRDGTIWAGTRTGGLYRVDPVRRLLAPALLGPAPAGEAPPGAVFAFHEDADGLLWLGTDAGVIRLDPQTGAWKRFRTEEPGTADLSGQTVRVFLADRRGGLWIGTLGGLYHLDPQTGRLRVFRHDPTARNGLSHDSIRALLEGPDGQIWIATWGGLDRLDPQTGQFHSFRHDPADPASLAHDELYSLAWDRRGYLWVGTNAHGLDRLDPRTGRFTHYRHDPDDLHSLSHNDVFTILEDRSGVLWIGTWSGLNKRTPLQEVFHHYAHLRQDPRGLSQSRVSAIFEDRAGTFWIGTLGGGLNRWDQREGTFRAYRHDPRNPASLSHDDVTYVCEDARGTLWVGTLGGGLNRFDRATGRFHRLVHDPTDPASLSDDNVVTMHLDRSGTLWIGTLDGGLNRLNADGRTFTHFRHDRDDPRSLGSDYVWSILEDRAGALWVGTFDGGLNRLDRHTGTFTRYRHDPHDPQSLTSNRIFMLALDARDRLWIGTMSGGLNRFDPATEHFTSYTTADGLPNEDVLGVVPDAAGRIWISTSNGLARFDPASEQFVRYSERDGLQSNVFHAGAAYRDRQGRLYFGGPRGLTVFDPDAAVRDTTPPPVVLRDVHVLDRRVPLTAELLAEGLALRHNQNFFSFEFAALDYTSPEHNRYAYRLEGLDEGWTESGRNFASYTSVPPGRFTLHVRAAGAAGTWNEGLALPVVVAPPYWRTWWFQLAATALLVAVLTSLYRYRVRQLLRLERMRGRIAANLHDDIGANLSSIALKSEMLLHQNGLPEPARRQLGDITQSVRQTAHVLREIVWVVNTDYDTLDRLLSKMEDLTSSMFEGCLAYTFVRPPGMHPQRPGMDFRQNVYFLYKEALHNILKHAGARRITVETAIHHGQFILKIEDDGAGFAPDEVPRGNGLNNMRRRATDLQGTLVVDSRPGEGTRITLTARIR